MLSPAASLELSTEAQRHQKRVKEEEEGEQTSREKKEDAQKALTEEGERKNTWEKLEEGEEKQPERVESTVKAEEVQERVPKKDAAEEEEEEEGGKSTEKTNKKEKVPVVQEQIGRPPAPTYPSLHTSTTVNWCYLNYVKPNPSALGNPGSSVYSTWSISAHNPNLPGLSTKVALSLLCSKQKHSSETYTMATAPTLDKAEATPESSSTQRVTEVNTFTTAVSRLAVPNGARNN